MKIVQLKSQNVKRLSAVEITPDGNVVVIGGKNGAGKSSVLDSILYALAGGSSIPEMPIRSGESKGEITLTLDGDPQLVIVRKFTAKGSTLEVRQVVNGVESKLTSPQAILDTLVGRIAFDPLSFTRMKAAEQTETLKALLGLDFSDLDAREKEAFDERTATNRTIKSLESRVDSQPYYDDAPEAEVSSAEVLAELEAAQAVNRDVEALAESAEEARRYANRQLAMYHSSVEARDSLKQQLADAEANVVALHADAQKAEQAAANEAKHAENAVGIDLAPIKAKLAGLEEANRKVRANAARAELTSEVKASHEYAQKLTAEVEAARSEKLKRLESAPWPVEGLSFGEHGVEYNGLPFEQCSSRERLCVSAAIGCAQNPKLPVMMIYDGSLLDPGGLAEVTRIAEQYDAQVWIERVSEGEECSVIIEDGAVRVEQPELQEAAV